MAATEDVAVRSVSTFRLWYLREAKLAYAYSKTEPSPDRETVIVWIPKSIVEHRTKFGSQHQVTIPDWFAVKNDL